MHWMYRFQIPDPDEILIGFRNLESGITESGISNLESGYAIMGRYFKKDALYGKRKTGTDAGTDQA